jgi:hypothetical protein
MPAVKERTVKPCFVVSLDFLHTLSYPLALEESRAFG